MRLLIFLAIFIFEISSVYSAELMEVSNYRNDYAPGETVQFDISFNGDLDKELDYSNLKLLSNNVNIDVSFTIEKISDNRYYAFFDLPSNIVSNTYKFKVYNVDIYYGGDLVRISNEYNFNVTNSNYSLSIYPGIFFNEDSSSLYVKNNLNYPIEVFLTGGNVALEYDNLYLGNQEETYVQFRGGLTNRNSGEIRLDYGDKHYIVPLYFSRIEDTIVPSVNVSNITTINKKNVIFIESSNLINKSLLTNESLSAPIRFYNNGDEDLRNLNVEISGNLNNVLRINQSSFNIIKKGQVGSFMVFINKDLRAREGIYEGSFKLVSDKVYDNIFVYLNFSKPKKIVPYLENKTVVDNKTNGTLIIRPKEEKKDFKAIITSIIVFLVVVIILILLNRKNKSKVKRQEKNFSYYLKR